MPKKVNMYWSELDDNFSQSTFTLPSPIQLITNDLLESKKIRLFLKRDDMIGDQLSGNKFRKLIFNLKFLKENGYNGCITFGGAFSNHIHAVAAAGRIFNIKTIGIIRGEAPKNLNPTLNFAKEQGMKLQFVSRKEYGDTHFKKRMSEEYRPTHYSIPEGGTNDLAIKGCQEIVTETLQQINEPIDQWMVCCGTGGTGAGIVSALKGNSKITLFQILKGAGMKEEMDLLLKNYSGNTFSNYNINQDYHFGGYAKWNQELIDFINKFKANFETALDPIYTGKMLFGIFDQIEKGMIKEGSTIVAIHTGGIQGIAGFNERFGALIH